MYPNLKLQIFRTGRHQNQLARALGIDETLLSKVIHGYRQPTPVQRRLLASYLEADEDWLFEKYDVGATQLGPWHNSRLGGKTQSNDEV